MKSDAGLLALSGTHRAMRVLAAEDNPVFQSMLRTMLTRWGYEAVMARDGNEAWSILEGADAPRLAVLDWMMPGMDGVEICRRIRSARREPYIYILLLTARTESQDLIEGMDAGADDYLTKPFNAHELRVRIRAGRRILDLQEELLQAREALREQATHDGLTGLLNRTTILENLDDELSRSARDGRPVSLLMIDLDRFKTVNDTQGHLAGDAVLRESASRLKSAERLREAIAGTPFRADSRPLNMTCSIGLACSSHCAAGALVREADDALYQAKARGRNCVVVHAAAGAGIAPP